MVVGSVQKRVVMRLSKRMSKVCVQRRKMMRGKFSVQLERVNHIPVLLVTDSSDRVSSHERLP